MRMFFGSCAIVLIIISPVLFFTFQNQKLSEKPVWNYQIPASSIVNKAVDCIVVSKDGSTIAAGARNHDVFLLDSKTGKLISTLQGQTNWIYAANFSGDGQFLISGDMQGGIIRWDLKSGLELQTYSISPVQISDLVPLGDQGEIVLVACGDGTVKKIDLIHSKIQQIFSLQNSPINCLSLSEDEKQILAGSTGGTICLFDIESQLKNDIFTNHKDPIIFMGFLKDITQFIVGFADNSICMFDLRTGKIIRSIDDVGAVVQKSRFTFQSNKFITVDQYYTYLWDVSLNSFIQKMSNLSVINSAAISPQGDYVLSADMMGNIQLFRLKINP